MNVGGRGLHQWVRGYGSAQLSGARKPGPCHIGPVRTLPKGWSREKKAPRGQGLRKLLDLFILITWLIQTGRIDVIVRGFYFLLVSGSETGRGVGRA